jgi:acyl dehydratase
LLYALCGDRNPLHRDPAVARAAGFERPILHGLCTYGIACRAILSEVCAYDAVRIGEFDARFSAPVFPGETIVTELWVDGSVVSFRSRVRERDVVVLNNGRCALNR